MSHRATNWAIQQKGLPPATKILLWHLADCHNAHTGRCDPSQERLAEECEMSRATVNRHLDRLEGAGLIRRRRRQNEDTKKRENTFYELAFDYEAKSQNETRPMSQNEQKPCLKNGDSHVSQLCDNNQEENQEIKPVKTGDLFPSSSNEVLQKKAKPKTQIEQDFEAFWESYPRKAEPDAAFKNYKRERKDASAEKLHLAAQRYSQKVARDQTETKYVKLAKNFLGTGAWKDHILEASDANTPEKELSQYQRNILRNGRVPPSMLDNGKPNAAAQYWLKQYGFKGELHDAE